MDVEGTVMDWERMKVRVEAGWRCSNVWSVTEGEVGLEGVRTGIRMWVGEALGVWKGLGHDCSFDWCLGLGLVWGPALTLDTHPPHLPANLSTASPPALLTYSRDNSTCSTREGAAGL